MKSTGVETFSPMIIHRDFLAKKRLWKICGVACYLFRYHFLIGAACCGRQIIVLELGCYCSASDMYMAEVDLPELIRMLTRPVLGHHCKEITPRWMNLEGALASRLLSHSEDRLPHH